VKLSDCLRYVLTASIAAGLATGCGGSQQPTGLPGTVPLGATDHKRVKRFIAPTTVYVGDAASNTVIAYPAGLANPAPKFAFTSLGGEPVGLAESASGNIYVSGYLDGNGSVDIYNSTGKQIG
jgi:hypothetical protein